MALISYIEMQTLKRLFDIENGYIFSYWTNKGKYFKKKTYEIILSACGIDIYNDAEFSGLSQQKCFEKIIASNNPKLIADMINGFCEYFSFAMAENPCWNPEDERDYRVAQNIVERLNNSEAVNLPEIQQYENVDILAQDIERNINNGTHELALDRLHTYATMYLREICSKHNLPIAADNGDAYAIHSIAGELKNYYIENKYCKSEFSTHAIKAMISLFEKFNAIRNDNSFAHPNDVLSKAEAEYVVKTMLSTLKFISKIEEANETFDDLPF